MSKDKQSAIPQIGWLCSCVPEEIVLAAGLNPTRLSGEKEAAGMADAYIYHNICPYVKGILDLGLQNKASHLDGLVFIRSCDAVRRLCDVWKSYVGTRFVYMIEMPKNRDEGAIRYFGTQLRKFIRSLEEEFGVKISNESLNEAIRTTNQNRRLMQEIYDLQKGDPLPIRASELFELGMDGMTIGKDAFYARLKQCYDRAKNLASKRREKAKNRILITGNVVDQVELFKLIEDTGAEVAAIDVCTGIRYFDTLIDEDTKDPVNALARRYMNKRLCARMTGLEQRFQQVKDLVDEYAVDGVVYSVVKFCDQHLWDAPYFADGLNAGGIPLLLLENDYSWQDIGRIRTRVEAFVEMLQEKERG